MGESNLIEAILVPQGAEYKAVCRGLSRISAPTPPVLPIPVGPKPLTKYLENLQKTENFLNRSQSRVLLMGVCGSLTPSHSVGDIVLYQSCIERLDTVTDEWCVTDKNKSSAQRYVATLPLPRSCDRSLTAWVHRTLKQKAVPVKGLTSDRPVHSAAQKHLLAELYNADVVDMEGFAALEVLERAGVAVAMVRVVSDDSQQDLPDLASAISPEGSLQSLPLAIGMIRQPLAATRLIRGSLQALQALQEVTTMLFANG